MLAHFRTFRRFANRSVKNTRGAAAVEFALIAAPLIFLIFSCIELALVILLSVTLDSATDKAARDIRTGITTQGNSTANSFKQTVCQGMGWLAGDCMSRLHLEVQTYDTFSAIPLTDPIKNGKFYPAVFPYKIGGGSKIQMVRAYYEWTLFTPFLNGGLTSLSNKDTVVSARVIFRNEPF
ncbi:MAG: TadE/TadG family type IV pilus assembly protein [Asticcacaulis sp.]